MLAADAEVDVGTSRSAELCRHLDEFADADLVEFGERIGLVDLLVVVRAEELAGVVTAETEGHLSEVVGAEGEELGFGRDRVCGERRARDLDHGADLVLHLDAGRLDALVGGLGDDGLDVRKLFDLADERDHDLGHDFPVRMSGLHCDRRLDDRFGLHDRDLGIGDGESASAVSHHGVELMQRSDDVLDFLDGHTHIVGKRLDVGFFRGDELVERRIQEADGDGSAFERFVESLEVALLHGQELGKSLFSLLDGVGDDHLAHGHDSVGLEEHMLGAAEADAFRAEGTCLTCVLGSVGIGPDLQCAVLVRPCHDPAEIARDGSVDGGNGFAVDVAGGAVEGDPVALMEGLAAERENFLVLVDDDVAAAGNAAGAHAARNDRRVGGHTAADGEDALCIVHALDVLGRGLETDENDFLFAFVDHPVGGVFGGEYDFAARRAGRGGKRAADGFGSLERLCVELGMQERVKLFGIDHADRFLLVDHALVDEVACDLESGGRGALAVSGLEHEELALFDGELHVLHISVVLLKRVDDLDELLIHRGIGLFEVGDGGRSAHACHDVLALCVHEVLAEESLLAGGGVAGERDAGAGGVAHVAEHHHLHVDRGAPIAGDVVHAAIVDGAGVVPAAEDRLDGAHELLLGILGEVGADLRLVFGLELLGELFEVVGVEFGVLLDALLRLHLVDELLEVLLADFHDDVGIHLNETTVAVVCETAVVGLDRESLHHFVVETEVEDGVHHAGHGSAGAGTHGNEQRIVQRAELLADELFELGNVLHDLGLDRVVDDFAVIVVLRAGFGGDGETLGHGHAELGHLRKVRAFAAEHCASVAIGLAGFFELVNEFLHLKPPVWS